MAYAETTLVLFVTIRKFYMLMKKGLVRLHASMFVGMVTNM